MKSKSLGNTLVNVPEIGFGTWNYHGGVEPLRKAIALGAILIDTAESYGTEQIVGAAIKGIREQVFLATKVLPKNFRRADLIAAAERSLKRLQTDYIDLCQLHWPNYRVPIEESIGAMEELVDAGKVRFVGVSNFSVGELKTAQAAASRFRIVSNQVHYSLIERTVEGGLLRYCQLNEITIIAYSPLGTGLQQIRAHDPEGVLARLAYTSQKTYAQIPLNWLIAKENVVAIPKTSDIKHVVDNCEASGWRLSDDEYRFLDVKIQCKRRGKIGSTLRRWKRYLVQSVGRQL